MPNPPHMPGLPGQPGGPPVEQVQFQDPKDQLMFQKSAPVIPDAGIYRTPNAAKASRQKTLPQVSSRILNTPVVQNAYASFGLEGLKSMLLQELVALDWEQLMDELVYLAEGANELTWIVDWPLMGWNREEERWDPYNHPFTSPAGEFDRPYPEALLREKFIALASDDLGAAGAAAAWDSARHVGERKSVRELTDGLRALTPISP